MPTTARENDDSMGDLAESFGGQRHALAVAVQKVRPLDMELDKRRRQTMAKNIADERKLKDPQTYNKQNQKSADKRKAKDPRAFQKSIDNTRAKDPLHFTKVVDNHKKASPHHYADVGKKNVFQVRNNKMNSAAENILLSRDMTPDRF